MAMDEEARLLGMLRRRLGQFERKVTAYREDLVDDFQLFYKDLLRDVAPPVASKVRRTISRSLSAGDYPLLNPELPYLFNVPNLPESPPPTIPSPELTPALVPPIQRHSQNPPPMTTPMTAPATTPTTTPTTASSAVLQTMLQHSPDSPQSREMSLQGLFVPSYLPLLESSPPQQAKPRPAALQTASAPVPAPATMLLPAPGIVAAGQGVTTNGHFASSDSPIPVPTTPQSPDQPDADRASNDGTNSSVVSDRSEPKTPRSALRRSSTSSNKTPQSPRRVRFDFMGAEVLPTASPQPTDFMIPRPFSPELSVEPVSAEIILGDGDEQPPPRKISSSEALRALSRTPLDESTVWTVVNANPDEILVEQEDLEAPRSSTSRRDRSDILPAAPEPPSATGPLPIRSGPRLGSLSEEPEEEADDAESSDDEFLSMAKPKPSPNNQTSDSQSLPGAEDASAAPVADRIPDAKMTNGDRPSALVDDLELDEEEMFQFDNFETGGLSAPPKPKPNSLPIKEEEEEKVEEQVDQLGRGSDGVSEIHAPLYATSPAVPIARQSALSGPITPTRTKFQTGSVGSYKGRPVIMPVVRNPEVHAQAATLGQFNTFVGGLDGRSGMDEGDLSSFRASVGNAAGFSDTPRSFTERLLMEEAQLQRASHSDPSQLR